MSGEAVGTKVDRLFALIAEKTAVQERASDLEKAIKDLERDIVAEMELAGLDKLTTEAGTVSRKEEAHPNVVDWDAFLDWVVRDPERRVFLFRRVNGGPFREALQTTGELPPGLEAFVRSGLNRRRSSEGRKT